MCESSDEVDRRQRLQLERRLGPPGRGHAVPEVDVVAPVEEVRIGQDREPGVAEDHGRRADEENRSLRGQWQQTVQSLQRTAPSWRAKVQCSGRRRFTDGVLAHVRTPGGPTRPVATTISTHLLPDFMSLPKLNPVEPPWYGPVCPVVGEGWHREVSPYPDQPHVRYSTEFARSNERFWHPKDKKIVVIPTAHEKTVIPTINVKKLVYAVSFVIISKRDLGIGILISAERRSTQIVCKQ